MKRANLLITPHSDGIKIVVIKNGYVFFQRNETTCVKYILFNLYRYVVPVCLYLYILSSTVGVLTLSQAMISELYPTEVRGMMCGLTEALATILSGISVHAFHMVKDHVDMGEVLLFFATFGILTVIFGKYILPETYGKSLTQIQREYFRRGTWGSIQKKETNNEVKDEVVQQSPTK